MSSCATGLASSSLVAPLVAAVRAVRWIALGAGVAGLTLTVVIAYAAWWLELWPHEFGDEGDAPTVAERRAAQLWPSLHPDDWPILRGGWTTGGVGYDVSVWTSWDRDLPENDEMLALEAAGKDWRAAWPRERRLVIEQAGWPLPAFTGGIFVGEKVPFPATREDIDVRFVGAIEAPWRAWHDELSPGHLPVTPYLPGLIGNVAFWGSVVFIAIGGPSRMLQAARAARDARRGGHGRLPAADEAPYALPADAGPSTADRAA